MYKKNEAEKVMMKKGKDRDEEEQNSRTNTGDTHLIKRMHQNPKESPSLTALFQTRQEDGKKREEWRSSSASSSCQK
jgi:hypothetical protein